MQVPSLVELWEAANWLERETRKYLRKYIRENHLSLAEMEELYQKIVDSVKTCA